jgi:hypothetical protein
LDVELQRSGQSSSGLRQINCRYQQRASRINESVERKRSSFAYPAERLRAVKKPTRKDIEISDAWSEADQRFREPLLAPDQEIDVARLSSGNVGFADSALAGRAR